MGSWERELGRVTQERRVFLSGYVKRRRSKNQRAGPSKSLVGDVANPAFDRRSDRGSFCLPLFSWRSPPHRHEVSLSNPRIAVPKPLPSQTFLSVGHLQRPTSNLPMCRKGSSFLSAGGSEDSSRTQKTLVNSRRLTRFPSALKLHRRHRHRHYALSTGI